PQMPRWVTVDEIKKCLPANMTDKDGAAKFIFAEIQYDRICNEYPDLKGLMDAEKSNFISFLSKSSTHNEVRTNTGEFYQVEEPTSSNLITTFQNNGLSVDLAKAYFAENLFQRLTLNLSNTNKTKFDV